MYSVMNTLKFEEPTNYVTSLPSKVKKKYFESSDYAEILILVNGQIFVHKLSTGVYFPCSSYNEAKGIRSIIVHRCSHIDFIMRG